MSALMVTALKQLSRLTLSRTRFPLTDLRSIHSQGHPLAFQASAILWSSPMKKKKKLDPQIVAHREQRKKKKIEKQIKRLEKFGRKLKPVDEIAGDMKLRKEMESRKRERTVLSFEESENRALLQKDWTRYKFRQHAEETAAIDRLVYCQQRALEELRKESEELYQQAIQIDDGLIPIEIQGPVSTPPIEDYKSPDGDYKDTTKKY